MSVTYDEKGSLVVKVKTQGGIDAAELRRTIQQPYPGAKVEGLENQPFRVVDEEKTEATKPEKKQKEQKKKKNEPLIRIVG